MGLFQLKKQIISGQLKQGQQATLSVKCDQIVAATHMGAANENLRHSTPTGDLHHGVARVGIFIDTNFFNLLNAASFEKLFGANAIRANGGGVHLDLLHDRQPRYQAFSTGKLAERQAPMPPAID
jgi:hypothetical protein